MGFALRLFHDEFPADHDWTRATLREIFDGWFIPKVLRSALQRTRPASDATISIYRTALDWWETTTGNPLARDIDDDALEKFLTGLRVATYRRGPASIPRKLSEASQQKQIQHIRTIIDRLRPGSEKPALTVLGELSKFSRRKVDHLPKPTPDFATFKEIFDRLGSSAGLRLCSPQHIQAVDFWRALLATLYCHGWRLSTALALDWRMLEMGKVNRLRLPAEANKKTHKAAIRPVPDWLLRHWRRQNIRFRTGEWPIPQEGLIFGGEFLPRTLARSWRRLQLAARPNAKPYSLQSLRRMHSKEVGRAGYDFQTQIAQASLQHSSRHITEAHYAEFLEDSILRLPPV